MASALLTKIALLLGEQVVPSSFATFSTLEENVYYFLRCRVARIKIIGIGIIYMPLAQQRLQDFYNYIKPAATAQ